MTKKENLTSFDLLYRNCPYKEVFIALEWVLQNTGNRSKESFIFTSFLAHTNAHGIERKYRIFYIFYKSLIMKVFRWRINFIGKSKVVWSIYPQWFHLIICLTFHVMASQTSALPFALIIETTSNLKYMIGWKIKFIVVFTSF